MAAAEDERGGVDPVDVGGGEGDLDDEVPALPNTLANWASFSFCSKHLILSSKIFVLFFSSETWLSRRAILVRAKFSSL